MKTTSGNVRYLFSFFRMFKSGKEDTVAINLGFGGPDCGMDFEIGKTYVVYSRNKHTGRCRRNFLAERSFDQGKLRYLYQNGFSDDMGKTINAVLTDNEAAAMIPSLFRRQTRGIFAY